MVRRREREGGLYKRIVEASPSLGLPFEFPPNRLITWQKCGRSTARATQVTGSGQSSEARRFPRRRSCRSRPASHAREADESRRRQPPPDASDTAFRYEAQQGWRLPRPSFFGHHPFHQAFSRNRCSPSTQAPKSMCSSQVARGQTPSSHQKALEMLVSTAVS